METTSYEIMQKRLHRIERAPCNKFLNMDGKGGETFRETKKLSSCTLTVKKLH